LFHKIFLIEKSVKNDRGFLIPAMIARVKFNQIQISLDKFTYIIFKLQNIKKNLSDSFQLFNNG